MKKDIVVYLVFILLTLVFFHGFLDASRIFSYKDLSRYFYPLRELMVSQMKSGNLPLWNPYCFCGYPFLAALQTGFFYPFSLLYYLMPFSLAFNWHTILHYFLAAAFTYGLMRHYQISRAGAFLAGLVFAYSGYLVSVSCMNTTLTSVIWLPLVVLFYDKHIRRRRFESSPSIGLVLSLACMFLGGEPTIIYVTFFILFAYGICFGATGKSRILNKRHCAMALIICLILALLLCAVQFLPFLEMLSLSERSGGGSFLAVSKGSLLPREAINILLPYFFGNPPKLQNYRILLGEGHQNWLNSPYLGFIPLFFAFFSLFKSNKIIKFWAAAGFLGLLAAFGRYFPLYHFLYKFVPGVSFIHFPVKFIFVTIFSSALLAGFGYDRFFYSGGNIYSRLKKKAAICLGALSFLLLSLFSAASTLRTELFKFVILKLGIRLQEFQYRILWDNLNYDILRIRDLALLIFIFALILYLIYLKKVSQKAGSFLVLAMVIFDLFSVNISLNTPINKSFYEKQTPNICLLQSDKSRFRYYLTDELETHNDSVYGEDYYQSILQMKDKLSSNRALYHRLYDFWGYESVVLKSGAELHWRIGDLKLEQRIKLLGSLNVKYVISLNPLKSKNLELLKHNADYYYGEIFIYENKLFLPRAYLIPTLEDFSNPLPGRTDIIKYSNNEVIIQTNSNDKGFLFLSDSYYPGWKASVDGKETKVLKANYRFRAVRLEDGMHKVIFSYEPASFKLGAIISLVTLLGLIALSISLGKEIFFTKFARNEKECLEIYIK